MADSEKATTELTDSGREAIARSLEVGGGISFALLALGIALNFGASTRGFGGVCLRAGLLALLASPVLRIIVASWMFARVGNRRLLKYALFSLAVISASIVVGLLRIGRP